MLCKQDSILSQNTKVLPTWVENLAIILGIIVGIVAGLFFWVVTQRLIAHWQISPTVVLLGYTTFGLLSLYLGNILVRWAYHLSGDGLITIPNASKINPPTVKPIAHGSEPRIKASENSPILFQNPKNASHAITIMAILKALKTQPKNKIKAFVIASTINIPPHKICNQCLKGLCLMRLALKNVPLHLWHLKRAKR